jgi:hypothetical protein
MLPHQERVLHERDALSDKVKDLMRFINSPTFDQIEQTERDRLMRQANHMMNYESVLRERVAAFDA